MRLIEKLLCAVFGHRYVVERVLSHGARKVVCTRCSKHWAMHDGTRSFVPWDGEFEEYYAPGGILAQASGDERDAERYRWLRARNEMSDGNPACTRFHGAFSLWNGAELDSAIDAAMAGNAEI